MNRNTRMLIYLFFAVGIVIVLLDCSRRMQQRKHKNASEPQSQNQDQGPNRTYSFYNSSRYT